MYLVPVHVPFFAEGERLWVQTEWRRALVLLRDSLGGKLGPITVVAPTLPVSSARDQVLEPAQDLDGIITVGSFDDRCRAREYWHSARKRWLADIAPLIKQARVVHGTVDQLYKPTALDGFVAGVQAGIPTVLVQDTDQVMQIRELSANSDLSTRVKDHLYVAALERTLRWSVSRASLSLLKGQALMDRYATYARRARCFHDTSHSLADVVSPELVTQRGPLEGRALRLVYCGRLIERKGVDHSLRIVAAARALGTDVQFDIIGGGPELQKLERLRDKLGIADAVRFLGMRSYGPDLIRALAAYDGLLFTPPVEDTPRMIFDAYAAGLPLIGYDIGYVRERVAEDRAGLCLPLGEVERAAAIVARLSTDTKTLQELGMRAREAGREHAWETWYQKRAEWTFEMLAAGGARAA
jgi:glycosyltransferase involved in cell wall biosynthesis